MQLSGGLGRDGGDALIDAVANDSPQMVVDAEERQMVLHLLGAVDEPVEVRFTL